MTLVMVNWNAVSAIAAAVAALATVGYLIASYKLWETAADNTKATKDMVQIGKLTADASALQAKTAAEQFELTKATLLSQMRPVLSFTSGKLARQTPIGWACKFVLRNSGQVAATKVKWELFVSSNNIPLTLVAPLASNVESVIVPNNEFPVDVPMRDDNLVQQIGMNGPIEATIHVSYAHPFEQERTYDSRIRLELDMFGTSRQLWTQ